jgi:transcriptional regulator with XRE-family HTH domain
MFSAITKGVCDMTDYEKAFVQALGQRVRGLRGNKALTRRELSLNSGVSERYLASLESGRANPSIAILCRLALALDMTLEGLLAVGQGGASVTDGRFVQVPARPVLGCRGGEAKREAC